MLTVDVRPSTDDIAGPSPEADLTLVILTNARSRISRKHTQNAYVDHGAVCAVGGVIRALGIKQNKCQSDLYFSGLGLEEELIDAAKTALHLLDKVAEELYPEYMGSYNRDYTAFCGRTVTPGNRLEDVNQSPSKDKAKEAVLACYDVAINRRKAELCVS